MRTLSPLQLVEHGRQLGHREVGSIDKSRRGRSFDHDEVSEFSSSAHSGLTLGSQTPIAC